MYNKGAARPEVGTNFGQTQLNGANGKGSHADILLVECPFEHLMGCCGPG